MADFNVLSEESLLKLQRDHELLKEQVRNLLRIQRPQKHIPHIDHKPAARVIFNATMTTTTASASCTITAQSTGDNDTGQYGPGLLNVTAVTCHNMETHTAGTYLFEANIGDAGLAVHDWGDEYYLLQVECP